MNVVTSNEEICVKYCRRSIQLALLLILILSAIAIVQLANVNASDITKNIMSLLPVYIVVSIVWLSTLRKKVGSMSSSDMFRIVIGDELRVHSLNRSFRSTFLLMIFSQIPMAYYFTVNNILNASIIQSIVTVVVGVTSFLMFFLIYDR